MIVAGRRGGKTTGAYTLAVEGMLAGRRVLEAAPTADQTSAFWDGCKRALAEAIDAGVIYKNETERLVEIRNGGRIRAKTAWDADTLRGDYADLLILDEYSFMKPSTWDEVGAPMLLDNNGDAIFIFTPQRKNHAHSLFARALGDDTGRWEAWHFTSLDNPYLSREALAEITHDMTEDAYKQEILAQFLENEGAVFHNIEACIHAPMDVTPAQHVGHRIVVGVDWGDRNDYTVMSFVCADCKHEVALYRLRGVGYIEYRKKLKQEFYYWNASLILPERNSMGQPVIQDLVVEDGLPIAAGPDGEVGFNTLPTTKAPLIESLQLAFERVECQWLDMPVATAELEAYEFKVSPITFKKQFSAPEGVHDDIVMARALAWWLARNAQPAHTEVITPNEYRISADDY